MAESYQWWAGVTLDSGGYTGEAITIEQDGTVLASFNYDGVAPKTYGLPATTTDSATGTATYSYSYLDSDSMNNNVATKVLLTVRDAWNVSFDNYNNMSVNITTTLLSAVRSISGSAPSNIPRLLWLRREKDSPAISPFTPKEDNGSTAHTIATNVNMGSYTFVLPPGQQGSRASFYWRNTMKGYQNRPIPNIYTDILYAGIHFKNILPPDYRPGQILDNNKVWQSHNRPTGADDVFNGSTWQTMRTDNGAVGTDNPPYMRHTSEWKNQRKIGANK